MNIFTKVKSSLMIDKNFIRAGVIIAVIIYILPFLIIYLSHNFLYPVGWDSAFYVEEAQKFQKEGLITYLEIHTYPNLYIIIIGLISYALGAYLTEILTPIFLGIVFILLNLKIGKILRFDKIQQVLLTILVATSLNFIRISADLHRQLLSLVFVYFTFILISKANDNKISLKTLLVVFSILGLQAITQVETFGILFLTLILYAIVRREIRLLAILLTLVAVATPFAVSYAPEYISSLKYVTTYFDISLAILFFGASLSPFAILGMVDLFFDFIKSSPSNVHNSTKKVKALISIYTIVLFIGLVGISIVGISFPYERIFLVIPVPIFITYSLNTVHRITQYKLISNAWIGFKEKLTRHVSVKPRNILVIFIILVSVIQATSFYHYHYRYFIPDAALDKLFYLKASDTLTKEPIFLIYNYSFMNPVDLDILRRYINTTVGKHLAYLGNLSMLLELQEPERYLSKLYQENVYFEIAKKLYLELLSQVKN